MAKRKYSTEAILSLPDCNACVEAEAKHHYREPEERVYKMEGKSFMIANSMLNSGSYLDLEVFRKKRGTVTSSVARSGIDPDIGDHVYVGNFWPMKIAPSTTMSPCAVGIVSGPLNGRGIYATVPVHIIYDMHGALQEGKTYEVGLGKIHVVNRYSAHSWPVPDDVFKECEYPEYPKKRSKN